MCGISEWWRLLKTVTSARTYIRTYEHALEQNGLDWNGTVLLYV